jgi:hypothetical protein
MKQPRGLDGVVMNPTGREQVLGAQGVSFRFSRWLGRLSVGRKLTLIYLLDLCAVIYVSGILIHEKSV